MKLWKGITAAALVLAVAPLVGVTTASQAEAATPTAVKAAATSYNPSCENPDGSYNGGVCKTTFPAYTEDLSDEPKNPIYLEWPGKKALDGSPSLNHAERVALLDSVHRQNVDRCKGYTPYDYRNDPNRWTRFCDGLTKPAVPYFQVKDVVTGALR
jgi:hypothetical protein